MRWSAFSEKPGAGEAIECAFDSVSDGTVVRSRPRWEMSNAAPGSAQQCLQLKLIVLVLLAKKIQFCFEKQVTRPSSVFQSLY